MKNTLTQLHSDIDLRVQSILEGRADWPCGKGCDSCCKHLADVPLLTLTEWELLREGLAALPPERLHEVCDNIAALTGGQPCTCPMLDISNGSCPVYAQRPVACRSYGFYVQRDKGLYCGVIEMKVAGGEFSEVVWGNHDAIDQQLSRLGERRSLTDLFHAWMAER